MPAFLTPSTQTRTHGHHGLLQGTLSRFAALFLLTACASTPKTSAAPEPCTGTEAVIVQNNSGAPVEVFIVGGAGMSLGMVSSRAELALPPRVRNLPWAFRAQTESGAPVRLARSSSRVTVTTVCRS